MATPNDGERRGLTESFRSQTGYGTAPLTSATKKTTPKTRKFIAKKVLRTDTLVGISLKYAVSVQELKRENKLWNTDHLFLREELLIPLTAENEGLLEDTDTIVVQDGFSPSPSSHSLSTGDAALPNGAASFASSNGNGRSHSSTVSSHPPHSSSPLFPEPPSSSSAKGLRTSSLPSSLPPSQPLSSTSKSPSSSLSSSSSSKRRSTQEPVAKSTAHGGSGDTITAAEPSISGGMSSMAEDFFSKYDTSIAQLRGDVEKMEKNAAKLDGLLDSNPLSLPPQALRRQSSSTSGYSRKGSAASLSSTSGSERDRRSRTAALLLDNDEESGSAAGASGGVTSGSSAGTTSAAVVHAQESPVLLIRSRSNNRQVKSAIENLRQVDDDLFEL